MTMEREPTRPWNFLTTGRPWLLAGGMLAVYLATLSCGVTAGNLRSVVELSGWNWQPEVAAPVTFLLTYPLRWLPARGIAPAANLCSALCAALTLALLARSVALLPGQRRISLLSPRMAWLPPALAVFACGLQLTFWENAIQAAGEILDLLLFAAAAWCVLEFRVTRQPSWLTRFAVGYGLALANNWAMAGFLPLFLVAFLWTRPLHLLDFRFAARALRLGWKAVAPELTADFRLCLRLALCGLAGLSLLLLLPLLAHFSTTRHFDFWPALLSELGAYKHMLFRFPKGVILLLSLTSILPALFMGIGRWSLRFQSDSRSPKSLAVRGVFYLIHAAWLLACIWVALDCPVSPRHRGLGFAFLPLYYLGALSIGYFSGYFLLVFGARNPNGLPRRSLEKLAAAATAGIGLLLLIVPSLLLYRNLPQIRAIHRDPWLGYFTLVEKSLPAQGSVILSDSSLPLLFFQAALVRDSKPFPYLPLDATALDKPAYQAFLGRAYPRFGLAGTQSNLFAECARPVGRVRLLEALAERHGLYYLHPSLGYYFEAFYPQAQGLVYQLKPYGSNVAIAPLPSPELIARNRQFWQEAETNQFAALARALQQGSPPAIPNWIQRLLARIHLQNEPNRSAQIVGARYARTLNYWGAELQEGRAYSEAAQYFRQARELNPDNVAARINQDFNADLQAGRPPVLAPATAIEEEAGHRRKWEQVILEDGPFAEPNYCYQVGSALARNGLYHQALQQFRRVQTLAPDLTDARFWMARLFIHTGHYSNALAAVNQILQAHPDDDNALFLKAVALLQSKAYEESLAPFTYLINHYPNNYAAQLNRAIAYLQLGRLDAARRDYEQVAQALPRSYQAWFGLAEIAYRRKDFPAAITNYQRYLTNAPPDTQEAGQVRARLEELQRNSP